MEGATAVPVDIPGAGEVNLGTITTFFVGEKVFALSSQTDNYRMVWRWPRGDD